MVSRVLVALIVIRNLAFFDRNFWNWKKWRHKKYGVKTFSCSHCDNKFGLFLTRISAIGRHEDTNSMVSKRSIFTWPSLSIKFQMTWNGQVTKVFFAVVFLFSIHVESKRMNKNRSRMCIRILKTFLQLDFSWRFIDFWLIEIKHSNQSHRPNIKTPFAFITTMMPIAQLKRILLLKNWL